MEEDAGAEEHLNGTAFLLPSTRSKMGERAS